MSAPTASPHSAENVSLARRTLTDPDFLTSVTPQWRAELVGAAFDILRRDWKARIRPDAAPGATGGLIAIPLSIFQHGPRRRQPRPRLRVYPATGGDAA